VFPKKRNTGLPGAKPKPLVANNEYDVLKL
jgi:hypothetical protein